MSLQPGDWESAQVHLSKALEELQKVSALHASNRMLVRIYLQEIEREIRRLSP